jgi:enamine deaminase RidA (YjgF/YER057c/UK114 family)
MSRIDNRLKELGVVLPPPASPVGYYVPFTRAGNLVVTAQGPLWGTELRYQGRVGDQLDLEQARDAARLATLNLISQLKIACDGSLDRMRRCLRLGGLIHATPEFDQHTAVMNAASELMVSIFDERGRHTRWVAGATNNPFGLAIQIEALFDVE